MVSPNQLPEFRHYLEEWSEDLNSLRQNNLLDEGAFVRFAKGRGIAVTTGELREFLQRGWLVSDGINYDGGPLFHPFRIFPLQKTLHECKLHSQTSSSSKIEEVSRLWNHAIDLATLLEPIYWPTITGRYSMPSGMQEDIRAVLLERYRARAMKVVASLNPALWREVHKSLRIDAAWKDDNDSLYLLLRLSTWSRREKLKGAISGALWIRHIAEVLRRAFEDVYPERWPEEDQAFGVWRQGPRIMVYGSDRPLDDELKSKPYLALSYGLFTGSTIRWYVEGDTEYYAILYAMPEPSKSGIELVNLRGNIESGKGSIALKLRDCLLEDKSLRRFSMISFDMDVAANVKSFRRQVEQKNIVGFIAAHEPDFEFANFTIEELVEIAARLDETKGISGDKVRSANWAGIGKGRDFETRYKEVSARKPPSLKGKEWGEALASYALEHPNRGDSNNERSFWREIQTALMGRIASYDFQKQHYDFDRNTFELVEVEVQVPLP